MCLTNLLFIEFFCIFLQNQRGEIEEPVIYSRCSRIGVHRIATKLILCMDSWTVY